MSETQSTLPSAEALAALIQNGCMAADGAVLRNPGPTAADETRTAIDAALRMLFDNGLIMAAPMDEWPEWLELDRWREIASR